MHVHRSIRRLQRDPVASRPPTKRRPTLESLEDRLLLSHGVIDRNPLPPLFPHSAAGGPPDAPGPPTLPGGGQVASDDIEHGPGPGTVELLKKPAPKPPALTAS